MSCWPDDIGGTGACSGDMYNFTGFVCTLMARGHYESYTIGGYQVMKKWLSYREKALLGRDLIPEEVREVMRMARRIARRTAAILLLQPQLDANYVAVKQNAYEWKVGG